MIQYFCAVALDYQNGILSGVASDVSKQPGPKRPNQQGCKSSCQDQSQRLSIDPFLSLSNQPRS
jgi:hypothetical protein